MWKLIILTYKSFVELLTTVNKNVHLLQSAIIKTLLLTGDTAFSAPQNELLTKSSISVLISLPERDGRKRLRTLKEVLRRNRLYHLHFFASSLHQWHLRLFATASAPQTNLNSGFVCLQNSADIPVLGPHPCTMIWVCAMIGPLKKALSVDLQIRMKGNSLNSLVAQNKDLGAASKTLLNKVKLRLWRCPNNRIFILLSGRGGPCYWSEC